MVRKLVKAILFLVVLVALLAAGIFVSAGSLVRRFVIPRIQARLGGNVTIQELAVRWGEIELAGILVESANGPAPIRIANLVAPFDVDRLLKAELALGEVLILHPQINVVRQETGEDNISNIMAHLNRSRSGGGGDDDGLIDWEVKSPTSVRVEGGTLSFIDNSIGSFEAVSCDGTVKHGPIAIHCSDVAVKLLAGPSARTEKLDASFELDGMHITGLPTVTVSGGSISFWHGFSLTGVMGGIKPGEVIPEAVPKILIDLKGGYGGVARVLWSANGWINPVARNGKLALRADRFDLGQLKPILAGTPVIDPELAQVDARLDLDLRGDKETPRHEHDAIDFDAQARLSGLSLFSPMLGQQAVRHLGFAASGHGRLEPRTRHLHLEEGKIEFRGVHASLTLDADRLGRQPSFSGQFKIAPIPCQTVLLALPAELTPAIQGFKLNGTFATDLHMAIDFDHLAQGIDLGGQVGIDGCKVLSAPEEMDAKRLLGQFEHTVEVVPGEWATFFVGPDNPEWVPLTEISPNLINSILTTEDSTFMQHHGFIASEFRTALRENLERGYFRLGASSITMQTVKNVLLSREKTLSRKLQELFLSWYLEKNLTKERILEIYLNVIEFGPRIYGIGRAAHHYFGKSAKELTPRESAWFSSILPSPKRRYIHYCKGLPDPKWEQYIDRILKRMKERHRLTQEEYQKALYAELKFDRAEAKPERECLEMVRRLTTPPPTVAQEAEGNGEEQGEARAAEP